jgi:hypothetical protein
MFYLGSKYIIIFDLVIIQEEGLCPIILEKKRQNWDSD